MRGKLFVTAALWAVCCSAVSAAAIEHVDVHLTSTGLPVPPLAGKRISASIETVAGVFSWSAMTVKWRKIRMFIKRR